MRSPRPGCSRIHGDKPVTQSLKIKSMASPMTIDDAWRPTRLHFVYLHTSVIPGRRQLFARKPITCWITAVIFSDGTTWTAGKGLALPETRPHGPSSCQMRARNQRPPYSLTAVLRPLRRLKRRGSTFLPSRAETRPSAFLGPGGVSVGTRVRVTNADAEPFGRSERHSRVAPARSSRRGCRSRRDEL